jgi:hypothetical protein
MPFILPVEEKRAADGRWVCQDAYFQPGDRLVEVELAEKFEVSRSPVREALLALAG